MTGGRKAQVIPFCVCQTLIEYLHNSQENIVHNDNEVDLYLQYPETASAVDELPNAQLKR